MTKKHSSIFRAGRSSTMTRSLFSFLFSFLCSEIVCATVYAGTITVQPGSCVNVSGQEICSASETSVGTAKLEVTYSCRYGVHKSGDLPGYKTYALIKVITDSSGKSTEVFVKDFGMKGKAKCEQAVEDRAK